MPEQGDRRVDLVEVDLGKGPVDELDVVPVAVTSLNLAFEDDLDVLGLAMAQVEPGGVRSVTGLWRAPSSRKPSPPGSPGRARHP